ncbi:MAG: YggS family pyridoxal phosphate-dependent enzyme [Deltaproteobacteria bacterium]|nr:YggS family pyridoxal phosphate-dependent enzyme [Deltaproteobacteria bacterium]
MADNLVRINDRIAEAARRSGRKPEEITLLAATKRVDIERIQEAVEAGVRVAGENYIQDAREKIARIGDKRIAWHFIGHLQRNKVKYAVELFDMIQTVDSIELAREIDKRSSTPIDLLIEVNIGGEETKSGVTGDEALELAGRMSEFQNLSLRGLMAIPPNSDDTRLSRRYFTRLRRLLEEINREGVVDRRLTVLSMGMSNDFEIAIEEGATMVRIGTALFGKRAAK